ncbi:hypothetical protein ACVWYH_005862 [Bradyrhizobium sp. GM24.11]
MAPERSGGVPALEHPNEDVLTLIDRATDRDGDRGGNEGQRDHERHRQRDHHRQSHRLEGLAFDAREREQRRIDENDDDLAIDRGTDHLRRRHLHGVETLLQRQHAAKRALTFGEMAQAVLGDDDGAIHDQAEIERPEAHQIGADPALEHARRGDQHGDRDDACRDKGGAEVAEQQEQHRDDEQRTFSQILSHGVDRGVDELRSIENGAGIDARRQGLADVLDLGVGGGGDGPAVAADQHQCGAEHDLASVDARTAGPQFLSDRDIGQIPDADGNAAPCGHHDLLDVLKILDTAGGPDHVALAVLLDVVRPAADVVGLDGGDDLLEGQPVADQLCGVGLHLELLDEAPDGVRAGDAGNGLHLRADDPVLHRAQVNGALEVVDQAFTFRRQIAAVGLPARLSVTNRCGRARFFVLDGPPVDLAEARRHRSQSNFDARREIGFGVVDALGDQLAREVDVSAVGKHRRDLREPVARERARRL